MLFSQVYLRRAVIVYKWSRMQHLTGSNKYDHISSLFASLLWLPIHVTPDFKLLLLRYIAVNGIAGSYLMELVVPHEPAGSLCFQGIGLLTVLKVKRRRWVCMFSFSCTISVVYESLFVMYCFFQLNLVVFF